MSGPLISLTIQNSITLTSEVITSNYTTYNPLNYIYETSGNNWIYYYIKQGSLYGQTPFDLTNVVITNTYTTSILVSICIIAQSGCGGQPFTPTSPTTYAYTTANGGGGGSGEIFQINNYLMTPGETITAVLCPYNNPPTYDNGEYVETSTNNQCSLTINNGKNNVTINGGGVGQDGVALTATLLNSAKQTYTFTGGQGGNGANGGTGGSCDTLTVADLNLKGYSNTTSTPTTFGTFFDNNHGNVLGGNGGNSGTALEAVYTGFSNTPVGNSASSNYYPSNGTPGSSYNSPYAGGFSTPIGITPGSGVPTAYCTTNFADGFSSFNLANGGLQNEGGSCSSFMFYYQLPQLPSS